MKAGKKEKKNHLPMKMIGTELERRMRMTMFKVKMVKK